MEIYFVYTTTNLVISCFSHLAFSCCTRHECIFFSICSLFLFEFILFMSTVLIPTFVPYGKNLLNTSFSFSSLLCILCFYKDVPLLFLYSPLSASYYCLLYASYTWNFVLSDEAYFQAAPGRSVRFAASCLKPMATKKANKMHVFMQAACFHFRIATMTVIGNMARSDHDTALNCVKRIN